MPIIHRRKCIQIHIPKTGGTSITDWIGIPKRMRNFYSYQQDSLYIEHNSIRYAAQHVPAFLLKEICCPYFDEYYKFSFVRNPYDRIISEFFWRNRTNETVKNGTQEIVLEMFKNFLKNLNLSLSNEIGRKWDHECPQSLFVFDNNKKLLVDDLFKLEDIDLAVEKISLKLNLKNKPQKLNERKSNLDMDKSLFLTDENKQIIYSLYKQDFDNFDYEK